MSFALSSATLSPSIKKDVSQVKYDRQAIKISNDFRNVINGVCCNTQEHLHGVNPATLEDLPDVPLSTPDDVDRAVDCARIASKTWAATPFQDRKAALLKFKDAIEAEVENFADLLVAEQGKPLNLAKFEIIYALKYLTTTIDLGDIREPQVVGESNGRKIMTRFTPLGVVCGIIPWNFPVALALGKLTGSVLTGNCVILKPSPYTPYCCLKLVELAQTCFPPGVLQVLSGDERLGPLLTDHHGIDKITFTGSVATGRLVAASAAKTLKRVTLELGGNDAAIICGDVNIEEIVPQVAQSALMNSGQVCVATKRVYVHESIYVEFRNAMVEHLKTLMVGPGTEQKTTCGPLQNKMQYERVKGFLDDATTTNQRMVVGEDYSGNEKGYFIAPTIIDDPPEDSRIVVEEQFADVLARANNTKMGLGASVWSNDASQARRMLFQLDAGTVWVNRHGDVGPDRPRGGFKESGLGVESGIQGMQAFCNSQTLII